MGGDGLLKPITVLGPTVGASIWYKKHNMYTNTHTQLMDKHTHTHM